MTSLKGSISEYLDNAECYVFEIDVVGVINPVALRKEVVLEKHEPPKSYSCNKNRYKCLFTGNSLKGIWPNLWLKCNAESTKAVKCDGMIHLECFLNMLRSKIGIVVSI